MNYLNAYLEAIGNEGKEKSALEQSEMLRKVREIEEQLKEPYRQALKNIVKSGQLRAEISKDLNENKPLNEVLDKALECISIMTGDELFYINNHKKLLGEGLK